MVWLILFIAAVIICLSAIMYLTWKTDLDNRTFRDKITKIVKKHDTVLFPPSSGKKGKVIPYRK